MAKLKRLIFMALYYGFTRHLPEHSAPRGMLFARLRLFSVQQLFKECGRGVSINRGAHFGKGDRLSIGDESSLGINARIVGHVTIERYVGMAHNVFITASNRDFSQVDVPIVHQSVRPDEQVIIHENCFIGCEVIILPGVHIGEGNVLAAGAVVARSTPPFAIVAGNPAKVVKWRKVPPPDYDFSRCIPLTEKARREWESASGRHAHTSSPSEVMAEIAG